MGNSTLASREITELFEVFNLFIPKGFSGVRDAESESKLIVINHRDSFYE